MAAAVELSAAARLEEALRARKQEVAAVECAVDKKLRTQAVSGCLAGLWLRIKALFGKSNGAYQPGTTTGVPKAVGSKLEQAGQAIELRIEKIEGKKMEAKAEAARLMKAGNKQGALRAMRKMKGVEKQVETLQASLSCVDRQVDALEVAEVQRTIASALKSSSKGMKAKKKLLESAEQSVDAAGEMRDLADDLSTVMAELGSHANGDHDDDDLLAELEAMGAEDDPPPPVRVSTPAQEAAKAMEALAEKHRAFDEGAALRAMMPKAPTRGNIEKVGLLAR